MHTLRTGSGGTGAMPAWVAASLLAHAALMYSLMDARLHTSTGGPPASPLGVRIEHPGRTESPAQDTVNRLQADATQPDVEPREEPAHVPDVAAPANTHDTRAAATDEIVSRTTALARQRHPAPAKPAASAKDREREGRESARESRPATDANARQSATHAQHDPHPSVDVDAAREAVRLRLARHFEYPRLARRRGWEGRVVVDFRLTAQGHLQDARVVEGSDHAMLDHAALEALRRIDRIPDAHELLRGRTVRLRLPVVYRLRG